MIPPRLPAEDLTLRPWRPEEVGMYLAGRDEEIYRFTTETTDLDELTCQQNMAEARDDPDQAPFAICDEEDRPIGNLAVHRTGRKAEISYWLVPDARGRGWGSAALRSASRWALQTWDVDYVELEIDPANDPSIRLAEAVGYRRYGTRLQSACGGPALLYRRER